MVHLTPPLAFQAKFSVVGCFMTCGDEILLLLRQAHKPQGSTWGVPGGKIETNEDPAQAVKRELFEETGIDTGQPLRQLKTTYVSHDGYDFVYLMFALDLPTKPEIKLDETSHQDYRWIKITELHTLPFIADLDIHMQLFSEQR